VKHQITVQCNAKALSNFLLLLLLQPMPIVIMTDEVPCRGKMAQPAI